MSENTFYILDDDGDYKVVNHTIHHQLPAGAYRAKGNYLEPVVLAADSYIQLPGEPERVYDLLKGFVDSDHKARYAELGMIYRMTLLMYGIPGTGKTALLMDIARRAVEDHGWIVLLVDNSPHGAMHCRASINTIRSAEPDRPIVVLWEELDAYAGLQETQIMELLDGKDQQGDVAFLLSTNFVHKIPQRILLRCRRIPHLVEFGMATSEQRAAFFDQKLSSIDEKYLAHTSREDIMEFSEGMTIDQCAQMVMEVVLLGKTPVEIREEIAARVKLFDVEGSDDDEETNGKAKASIAKQWLQSVVSVPIEEKCCE